MLINPAPPVLVSIFRTTDPALVASSKVLEGLLAYDFDLRPKPQLATAWTVNPDGLKYTFTLRQNVKWHDGHHEPRPRGTAWFSAAIVCERRRRRSRRSRPPERGHRLPRVRWRNEGDEGGAADQPKDSA
ncbi:hypothetical protein J2797_004559 [Paraburkholderia terricola]|jgi:hypothetical protein|nr:hypothetical protein [Paraburkholderia terricola]